MQISLRKANAIQVAINETLKGLEFKTDISINEFQNPEKELDAASRKFGKNLSRRAALLDSLYEIRESTGVANAEHAVDARLTSLARIEKDLAFYTGLAKTAERTDLKVIGGRLDKISNRTDESYYHKAEVETTIFTQAEIDSFRTTVAGLKKQKQKLQDELLELNVRTVIELSERTVEVLKSEDII